MKRNASKGVGGLILAMQEGLGMSQFFKNLLVDLLV